MNKETKAQEDKRLLAKIQALSNLQEAVQIMKRMGFTETEIKALIPEMFRG